MKELLETCENLAATYMNVIYYIIVQNILKYSYSIVYMYSVV